MSQIQPLDAGINKSFKDHIVHNGNVKNQLQSQKGNQQQQQ